MIWSPTFSARRSSQKRSHCPLLGAVLGSLLAACAGSGNGAQVQPVRSEPAADPSTQVTLNSAAKPNRNSTPTNLGHDGPETHLTAINDCELPQCIGDAPAQLVAAIRDRAAQARSCYEEALKATPSAAGRLVVELRITHEGQACPVRVSTNELAESKTLLPCLRSIMERNYPRPSAGCVDFQLPLRFVPEFIESDAGTR